MAVAAEKVEVPNLVSHERGDDMVSPWGDVVVLRKENAELARQEFRRDVEEGLRSSDKFLSSMYFYDDVGSELFSKITELKDYYPTDCEIDVLQSHCRDIANALTSDDGKESAPVNLIELGAGDGRKTCILLEALLEKRINFRFFPIDISQKAVEMLLLRINKRFGKAVKVHGIVGDNEQGLCWIRQTFSEGRNVALFLGSSIGNFPAEQATGFLKSVNQSLRSGDKLLIGFDLLKDPETMRRAYSDSEGVTAEFNRNLLRRINNELGADFDPEAFYHVANYNVKLNGMESSLVSAKDQVVTIPGSGSYKFSAFEGMHTEYSFKYSMRSIQSMADLSGFELSRSFQDRRNWFVDTIWTVR